VRDHDEEDVPDEEPRTSRRATRGGECRVFVLGVLVGLVRESLPRLDVTVKFPLLFVDERLHVDTGQLAAVFLQFYLELRPLRRDRQRQVLRTRQLSQ